MLVKIEGIQEEKVVEEVDWRRRWLIVKEDVVVVFTRENGGGGNLIRVVM